MKMFSYIAVMCSAAGAQWPDSPETNLAICTAGGEQAITKIATTQDGGCYVSWFDNRSGGYDVYMQLLDAEGNALWQPDGILVADRNYSSVMDFDLGLDALGNAIVVYRKNMVGGGDGIVVTSVDETGSINWNATVQGGGAFVASPVVSITTTLIVVGWISDEVSRFQQLGLDGTQYWTPVVEISDPAGGSMQVADIHPSLDGSVVASFVQYTTFWGTKRLKAQRFDVDGNALWPELVSVMNDNSLQIGSYPDFVSDGEGGGFFTWYGVSPLQSYAAHILSDGTHGYGDAVQVASSFGSTERVNPVGVRDSDEFVVFFRPQDNGQNNDGIAAQRLASDGTRMWGNAGVSLKPTSSSPQYGSFAVAETDLGTSMFFTESPSFGNDVLNGVSLDSKGNFQWTSQFISVASTPSSKSRVVAASVGSGVLLAWQEDRNDGNDIYGQRVNSDGSLGNGTQCEGDVNNDGVVGVTDVLSAIGAWGLCPLIGDCPADFNNDGFVDVGDLLTIIGAWGICP